MRATVGALIFVVVGCHSLPSSNVLSLGAPLPHDTQSPRTRSSSEAPLRVQETFSSKLPKDVSDLLRYSPNNVEIVLVLTPSQIKTGSIWSSYGSMFEEAINQEETFKDFVKEANWNPLDQTSQAYLALTDIDKSEPSAVIVLRGKNLKNIQDSLIKDSSMKQTTFKGSTLYTDPVDSFSIVFPSSDIVVFGDTVEVKEALAASGPSKDMTALLGSANTSTGTFGAFLPSKQARKEMSAAMPEGFPSIDGMTGFYFSLSTSKGFDFVSGARFTKKEDATNAKLFFSLALASQEDQWQDEGLWPYFSPMKLETSQSDLVFSWKLPERDSLSMLEVFVGPSKTSVASKKKHKSNLGGK